MTSDGATEPSEEPTPTAAPTPAPYAFSDADVKIAAATLDAATPKAALTGMTFSTSCGPSKLGVSQRSQEL